LSRFYSSFKRVFCPVVLTIPERTKSLANQCLVENYGSSGVNPVVFYGINSINFSYWVTPCAQCGTDNVVTSCCTGYINFTVQTDMRIIIQQTGCRHFFS